MNGRTRAVVGTLLPSAAHPTLLLGALDSGFESFLADFEATASRRVRTGFRAAVFVAVWVTPVLIRRLPPLSRHSQDTRERALEAMARSDSYLLRQLFGLLKVVVAFGYGADPEVRAAIGYPSTGGPP